MQQEQQTYGETVRQTILRLNREGNYSDILSLIEETDLQLLTPDELAFVLYSKAMILYNLQRIDETVEVALLLVSHERIMNIHKCKTHNLLAIIELNRGNLEQASVYNSMSFPAEEDLEKAPVATINAYITKSLIAEPKGGYIEMLENYFKAVEIAEQYNEQQSLVKLYNNIAVVYMNTSLTQKAIQYYQLSLAMKRTLGDTAGIAMTLNNIGSTYIDFKEPGIALSYLEEASQLWETLPNTPLNGNGKALTLLNKGVVFELQEKYHEAIHSTTLALELYTTLQNKYEIAHCKQNLSNLYAIITDYIQAVEYIQSAIEICRTEQYDILLYSCYYIFAEIVYETKGDIAQSLQLLEDALHIADSHGYNKGKLEIYRLFKKYNEISGDYKRAFHSTEELLLIQQKINAEREKFIAADIDLQMRKEQLLIQQERQVVESLQREKMQLQEELQVKQYKEQYYHTQQKNLQLLLAKERQQAELRLLKQKYQTEITQLRTSIHEKTRFLEQVESELRRLHTLTNADEIKKGLRSFHAMLQQEVKKAREEAQNIAQELLNNQLEKIELLRMKYPEISRAEADVAVLTMLGFSSVEIAALLYRSHRTIENQRQSIRKKLRLAFGQKIETAMLQLS